MNTSKTPIQTVYQHFIQFYQEQVRNNRVKHPHRRLLSFGNIQNENQEATTFDFVVNYKHLGALFQSNQDSLIFRVSAECDRNNILIKITEITLFEDEQLQPYTCYSVEVSERANILAFDYIFRDLTTHIVRLFEATKKPVMIYNGLSVKCCLNLTSDIQDTRKRMKRLKDYSLDYLFMREEERNKTYPNLRYLEYRQLVSNGVTRVFYWFDEEGELHYCLLGRGNAKTYMLKLNEKQQKYIQILLEATDEKTIMDLKQTEAGYLGDDSHPYSVLVETVYRQLLASDFTRGEYGVRLLSDFGEQYQYTVKSHIREGYRLFNEYTSKQQIIQIGQNEIEKENVVRQWVKIETLTPEGGLTKIFTEDYLVNQANLDLLFLDKVAGARTLIVHNRLTWITSMGIRNYLDALNKQFDESFYFLLPTELSLATEFVDYPFDQDWLEAKLNVVAVPKEGARVIYPFVLRFNYGESNLVNLTTVFHKRGESVTHLRPVQVGTLDARYYPLDRERWVYSFNTFNEKVFPTYHHARTVCLNRTPMKPESDSYSLRQVIQYLKESNLYLSSKKFCHHVFDNGLEIRYHRLSPASSVQIYRQGDERNDLNLTFDYVSKPPYSKPTLALKFAFTHGEELAEYTWEERITLETSSGFPSMGAINALVEQHGHRWLDKRQRMIS